MNYRHVLTHVLAISLVTTHVMANTPHPLEDVPNKYDQNGNGVLDIGLEEDTYLLHRRNKDLAKFDSNMNGRLDGGEIAKFNRWQARLLSDDQLDAASYRAGLKEPVAVAAPDIAAPDGKPTDVITASGWFVRDAYSASSILGETIGAKDLSKVKPATMSFTRDNEANANQYSFSGSIFGYKRWSYRNAESSFLGAEASAISAGVVFDRVVSSDPDANETDALTFRTDLDLAFQKWPLFNTHFVTLSGSVSSDFDLETALMTGSVKWEPVHNDYAIGVAPQIWGLPVAVRWSPTLSAEYQYVAADGGQPQLADKESYVFLAPRLSAQVFLDFPPFDGAFVDVGYAFFDSLNDSTGNFDYFEASANLPLDRDDHLLFNIKYRNGETPTVRQEVDDLLIGLGARF